MLFAQADSTKSLKDGAAGITPLDRSILRCLWGENEEKAPPLAQDLRGAAARGFDVASLMFTLHYFFKDVSTLNGFLRNLADSVKVGGLFVGCCFDGDSVYSLLKDVPKGGVKRGVEAEADVWTIKKQYDDAVSAGNGSTATATRGGVATARGGVAAAAEAATAAANAAGEITPEQEARARAAAGLLDPTELGLGKAIDVNFVSIGATHTEYLVSFPYLLKRMEGIGFTLLNPEELEEMRLKSSTNTFDVSYDMAAAGGYTYPMSTPLKTFSFLNRWFIFKRRSTGRNRDRAINKVATELTEEALAEATAAIASAEAEAVAEAVALALPPSAATAPVEPAGTVDLLEPEGVALPLVEEGEGEEGVGGAGEAAEAEAEAEETIGAARGGAGGPPEVEGKAVAATTLFAFYHKSAAKDDFKRKDKHWRRFLSTYAPFEYRDKDKADIIYPTLEAALGAEKFKVATNRKELGPQIFGSLGTIHQNVAARLAALSAGGKKATMDDMSPLLEEQGEAQRDAQKPAHIKEVGAKWNTKAWTSAVVSDLLATYLRQRMERDEQFRRILADVKKAGGSLVYVGGGGDLGGKVVGDAVKGDNLYGEALNAIVKKMV